MRKFLAGFILLVGCGKKNGVEKEYYKNGVLYSETPYKNDSIDGIDKLPAAMYMVHIKSPTIEASEKLIISKK